MMPMWSFRLHLQLLLPVLLALFAVPVRAQAPKAKPDSVAQHSVRIYYRLAYSIFQPQLEDNGSRLQAFCKSYKELGDTALITISGSASPEGSLKWRGPLARKRAQNLVAQLSEAGIPRCNITFGPVAVDWQQLRDSVAADSGVPQQQQVLEILDSHVGDEIATRRKIKAVAAGAAWRYLSRRFFPAMRYSQASFEIPYYFPKPEPVEEEQWPVEEIAVMEEEVVELQPPVEIVAKPLPPRYWTLKTNMLHDIILIPNIGLEWAFKPQWSISGDYSGAWWGNKWRTHLWRYYGGNLEVKYYFGEVARQKPLQGWHVGVYGEFASYDFQLNRRGVQGRRNWGGGVIAGYMLPISRHFNIDFALALGYFGGRYRTCRHEEPYCEVWTGTYMRRWWGPTRAEVTLCWLLGRGNFNPSKRR